MMTKTTQPRKQRKRRYTAPLHRRGKMIAAHLSEDLMLKYNRRSLPVRKGDTVKVMRGLFRRHIGKVTAVDTKAYRITVEGVTIAKSDGAQVTMSISPSNVLITKLDLSDPWRRRKLAATAGVEVMPEPESEVEAVEDAEKNDETKESSTSESEEKPEEVDDDEQTS